MIVVTEATGKVGRPLVPSRPGSLTRAPYAAAQHAPLDERDLFARPAA